MTINSFFSDQTGRVLWPKAVLISNCDRELLSPVRDPKRIYRCDQECKIWVWKPGETNKQVEGLGVYEPALKKEAGWSTAGVGLFAGNFAAIFSAAPVISGSSFRNVKRIGVIAAISSWSSASVIQRNQPFQNVIVVLFHCPDQNGWSKKKRAVCFPSISV